MGVSLFPQGDFQFDDGVWMTAGGAERLIGNPHDNAAIHGLVYDWAPGIDADAADASIGVEPDQIDVSAPPVANLRGVVGLTQLLAIVFGTMAVALLVHASMAAGRRGRHEHSTLQALGLVDGQRQAIGAVHLVTLTAAATTIGLPLGLSAGSRIWTQIAQDVHVLAAMDHDASTLVLAWALLAGALTVLTVPAIVRRRHGPIDALRAE